MGIVMNAENDLEKAVWQGDAALVMQAVAEGENLNRLAAVSCLDNENFSDAVIFSVLLIALRREQLQTMTSEWCQKRLRIGERLKKLVQEALEPLPQTSGNIEKAFAEASASGNSAEVCQLIENGGKINTFTPELLLNLPQLDRNAVWNLFQHAFSAKLKAVVLDILLSEVFEADLLKSFSYRERVLYANLLLHIISGESAAPDMPRFPEQAGDCTYCFDPQHCFDPDSMPQ